MDEITAKAKMQELVQVLVANGYSILLNDNWSAMLTDDNMNAGEPRVVVSLAICRTFGGDNHKIRTRVNVYHDFGGGETRTLEESTNKADASNIIEIIYNVKQRMQLCATKS